MPSSRLPRTVLRSWAIAFALASSCVVATASHAIDEEDETQRFVPSFSFAFDAIGQRAEASIRSSPVLGSPITEGGCDVLVSPGFPPFIPPVRRRNGSVCPGRPVTVQPGEDGNDINALPLVVASVELMAPSFLDRWLRPRLFGHVDVAAAFGFERNLAGAGKPGFMGIPELPQTQNTTSEEVITGQGSRAKMQTGRWVLSGGAGIAFTTEVMRRRLRIKPSFEVIREEVDLIGAVHRAVALESPAQVDVNDYRFIILTAEKTETLWGIGPGLEIEIDTVPTGPIMMSVFMNGRGYRFLGNLHTTLSARNEFGESSTFRFELDPWAWRGGVGLRFRWIR